jgi:ligand-binding sensor domain-containing protein/signal transduction histidine kinase
MVVFACAAPAASTNSLWSARVWQSDEGLPDNTVVGVEQTPDGFLWVATQAGLVRFDGLQFRQFTPVTAAGVPTSLIQAILLDHRGRLWVAKDRRVVVCVDQGRTTSVVTSGNGLPNLEARMMVEDPEGAVWVSYIGGEVVRIQDGRVRSFTSKDGLPVGGTCQLARDKAGQLWFSVGEWLGVFRDGKFLPLVNLRGQRITGARSGGIWVCTGKQLYKYTEGGSPLKVGDLPARGRDVNPTVLYEGRGGRLWIGTREAGLFSYDGAGFATVITSHQEILSVMEDRERNFWVGTRGGGLNRLKPRVVELLATDSSIPFEAVQSVCQDTAGLLWTVAQNGVVSRSAGHSWTPLSTNDGWSVPYARCVAADPKGGVWIGTQYSGLRRWQDGAVTATLSKANGLTDDFVSALLAPASGEVWIGTESVDAQHHSLQRCQAEQSRTFNLPLESGPIAALAVDLAGDCWAATSAGLLLRAHGDVLLDETSNTLALPQAIRCLLATPDGSLWIGYAGEGLGRLKAGSFSHYRMEQGLHDDYVSQIVSDGRGRLWFAGNRGIFNVRETDLDDLAEGQISRVRSVAYGQNEGLPRLQASHGCWPGALRGKDDRLWFAMQSGLAVVHAADLRENLQPPVVVLERVTANGRTVAAYESGVPSAAPGSSVPLELSADDAHLRLLPGQRQVEFVFTALSFVMPETIEFKYRLHGLDAGWVDAGTRRVAYYPQIPPGDYRFQIIACNNDGLWNETGAVLALTAEPYWWQMAWFRVVGPLSAVGLLGGGIFLGVRRRHRRQIEHFELLQATERERARIAQDLHDDLGAGLTQISLNTALVQNPAVTPEVAGGLLQEIDQRSRELVTALDEIVWAVNPKNDTVPSLARYFCQFAQNCLLPGDITCRLEVAPVLPDAPVGAEQRHHLFLAFKEALHNTLRHSGANELRLEIAADAQTLSVTLADNGHGFVLKPTPEGADGLGNMRSRLERLGGSCVVTSEPGRGTTVVFRLPLGANGK